VSARVLPSSATTLVRSIPVTPDGPDFLPFSPNFHFAANNLIIDRSLESKYLQKRNDDTGVYSLFPSEDKLMMMKRSEGGNDGKKSYP
jgi:hypothetical protein